MGRKTVPLAPEHVERLPAPCSTCLFWQLDPVRRAQIAATEAVKVKAEWVAEVTSEWGVCGQVILVDGAPAAYAIYAPPAHLPGSAAFPTAPTSPDAVLLATLRVAPQHRGGGLGRVLVQSMARDLVRRRETRAVEAFGTRNGTPSLTPASFLAAVGFTEHRPHPTTPRMRMELRSTVSWMTEVEAALEGLVIAVRPGKRHAADPGGAGRVGVVEREPLRPR